MQFSALYLRRWCFTLLLPTLHSALLLLFVFLYTLPSSDPNHGMAWLFPYMVDRPLSYVAERLLFPSVSMPLRVLVYLCFGGVQWGVIGYLIDRFLPRPSPRKP
jgi:hypothetical protein